MNVTNRRNSTDADTQQPTQPTQQQQLLAYVSCRQAATATRTRQDHLQSLHNRGHELLEDKNDDQEQVVTSTSSDCLLPLAAEGEGEEITLELENLVTSPARITSSTNNYEILTYNSDSLSREELVMPSTSDNCRLVREGSSTTASAAAPAASSSSSSSSLSSLNSTTHRHSINTRILKSTNAMVARDTTATTVAEAGDSGGSATDGNASTSSNSPDNANESHKIILKLPKPSLAAPTESHNPANSFIEDDLRKVEPLKINLHNTHHTSHHTPKITIKPIIKEPPADILMSSEECSSSAEEEVVSKLNASEPHIVPKLTIRAENEELSTVVPKLTIKINDSTNVSSESHSSAHPAANTPPLPKLTIKTGQDGHSESIITNISPASSTTSSSSSSFSSSSTSTNSQAATNSSAANIVPKLTIKPLQKSHEMPVSEQHPSIPKLCIKGNMICGEVVAVTEDATTSKIPKLTIKTGQEHAVIITQHNDHVNALGGIPKLTIKTKSLDSTEDSNNSNASNAENLPNEKIPKITIKTNIMDSPNIVLPKKSIIKTQLEASSSPLSPKQAVPKLTITRQQNDMVVTNKHTINTEDECGSGSIPKMTIKTQNKTETVPKLTIKNISSQQQRPSSTEESGMESDNEDDEVEKAGVKNSVMAQPCKTVPKLTIKNLGSPQQKLTIVQEMPPEVNKTNSIVNAAALAASDSGNVTAVASSSGDTDEFADLINVDNGGGESSNSQEFCGFNDNTADSTAKVVVITSSDLIVPTDGSEGRRNSDDMDIDEDLRTIHEPKIFQNDIHFQTQPTDMAELLNGKIVHPKITHIIDTVDLTSSPSRSCSPAQFDYNEDSNSNPSNVNNLAATTLAITSTNILLDRLQRETTVIQNTQQVKHHQHQQQPSQQIENNSPAIIPPPLQPKPNTMQASPPPSLKYPQLAERLMANGTSPNAGSIKNNYTTCSLPPENLHSAKEENIIDSIEILDTPEGSPHHSLEESTENLSSHLNNEKPILNLPNGLHYPLRDSDQLYSFNNSNSNLKRHALATNLIGQINQPNHTEENSIEELAVPPSKQRRLNNEAINTKNLHLAANNNNDLTNQKILNSLEELNQVTMAAAVTASVAAATPATGIATVVTKPNDCNFLKQTTTLVTSHHRSRKQKHENLLPIAMEEVVEPAQVNFNDSQCELSVGKNGSNQQQTVENPTPVQKKRGRPRKLVNTSLSASSNDINAITPTAATQKDETDLSSKTRRVQLLRKRLAIDMVDADEPLRVLDELELSKAGGECEENKGDIQEMDSQKRERNLRTPLRTSRRSITPTVVQMENKTKVRATSSLTVDNNNKKSQIKQNNEKALNNFLESNCSSISSSSVCSSNSVTLTTSIAAPSQHHTLSMATQIDLTMSSSSSNSNGSSTNTITTVEGGKFAKQATLMQCNTMPHLIMGGSGSASNSAITCVGAIGSGGSSNNSMLPPATILSSSDPLPDVVFKHNDFSSILATQQLRPLIMSSMDGILNESQEEDMADDVSGPDNSGDDSASSSSMSTTPGRGRGRGRGSRGGRGRGYKAHRLGRNASAVSKAIAMNRPRCVGALKHTPDPDRIKGLYSPSPSVFEEDTRMSADLSQTLTQSETPQTPVKQPDFLNNEESQSSIISNTSILDPNNVPAIQNGSSVKKPPAKRKKMEVCVAEDAELTVSSIAEYDWPPPKGCCPSKNRDTFMIQEQVALYLGIKSFKRKYPDLPRRQIDMEERNYLQEKNLVSEKMCDLGITAVWASDILDIMYTDFYDKYEEYKDFVRQKHLREIEAKQKSLGLNVAGRGLQARDRAMLSASKWNAYFNRTRKEERLSCLDLQTLTVNKPCPAAAPIAAITNRPVADAVARAAKMEKIPQPPTLLKEHMWEPIRTRDVYYPLSLVPGQFCAKYYDYTAQELRQFPLNTVLETASHFTLKREECSDTDSVAETDDGKVSNISASERLRKQRRIRRIRAKHTRKLNNNEEFKVPPLPGAVSNSSTETDSSATSDDSSTDTDSDTSSCSSSTSDDSSENENMPGATCGVCQHPQNRNLKDLPELFIQCYTCRRKVHPSCIEMPHRMSIRVRNYNWQCTDCKCCIKCKRKQDQNKMLYCEQCDRGFHIYCLSIKAVPDGRWSCERCSICMRCGATKPEGLPIIQPNGEKLKVKHRKLKWINEYRIDHVTKLREHCSMLCVPCGRSKNVKRVQINTHHNTANTYVIPAASSPGSPCGSAAVSPNSPNMHSPISTPSITMATATTLPQMSPININGSTTTTITAAAATTTTTTTNLNLINAATTTQITNTNQALSTITSSITTATTAAKSLESKDSISIAATTNSSLTVTNTVTPQNTPNTTTIQTISINAPSLPSTSLISDTTYATNAATTSITTTTTTSGGGPPVVA